MDVRGLWRGGARTVCKRVAIVGYGKMSLAPEEGIENSIYRMERERSLKYKALF